jgi:N-methylhydantoinase A
MRIGFDIGGTFTDIVAVRDDGRLVTAKLLSFVETIGERIAEVIEGPGEGEAVQAFVHATTTASNAVIERKTARTGLLCTHGFRDDLEMRGQRRPNIYDFNWDRLPPLIERALRLEVDERILADGSIDRPLDERQAEQAIARLAAEGVEAIAVCLVNAYLNPQHEQRLRALVARLTPQTVCALSHEIDPEIGEYERASTTAINAALTPVFERYLGRLEAKLAAYSRRFLIMQSNGGIASAQAARRRPGDLIESGPAAGVLAAARLAQELALDKVLSFDMGGTTAKACLIENGAPLEKTGGEVGGAATSASRLFGSGGHILRAPWLDIVEVGAGGGSIAWVENGAVLKVGPQSAGADPGPVCYSLGGTQPTLTDANVVLGYINPKSIAGATVAIDRQAAWEAIEHHLAEPLGLGVLDAALGMTRVANATMMRALRAVSTERGRDPRDFTLIAFGGGGPLHAASIADTLDIRRICVPIYPGLFSALGLLLADHRQELVRPVAERLDRTDPQRVFELYAEMAREAEAELAAVDGAGGLEVTRLVSVKYAFQVGPMTLPLPPDTTPAAFAASVATLFAEANRARFGHSPADPVDLVSVRLRAIRPSGAPRFAELAKSVRLAPSDGPPPKRPAYFGAEHGLIDTPVCTRADVCGATPGPLIIEEPDTTLVIPPGWTVIKDASENLLLQRGAEP